MKPRTMLALPLVAALAGLWQSPTQAAPATATTTTTTDLRGVTQNWDKILPPEPSGTGCPNWSARFTCVLNNAAVRDNETGLVWEQPSEEVYDWWAAKAACVTRSTGNRRGWRLPTLTELLTLIDTSSPTDLKLPKYVPFIYKQGSYRLFWTATAWDKPPTSGAPPGAWLVMPEDNVRPTSNLFVLAKTEKAFVWCVRGGSTSLDGAY